LRICRNSEVIGEEEDQQQANQEEDEASMEDCGGILM